MDGDRRAQREAISRALLDRHGGKRRREWIDHFCLFHEDRHRSASWAEENGVYYCRTEDRVYYTPQVLDKLLIPTTPLMGKRKKPPAEVLPPITQATIYTYIRPDGSVSHLKFRWGDGHDKLIRQTSLDFDWVRPADAYPIYGDFGLTREQPTHIVVVEGEKCVDRIDQLGDSLAGSSIRAITCGSNSELRKYAVELVGVLGQLHPLSITLWPDNDEPGLAAMRHVHVELQRASLAHSLISPAELGLPLKGDVCDYADAGGSLSVLLAKQTGTLEHEPVRELVEETVVTRDGHFMWPMARVPTAIKEDYMDALWQHKYGALPKTNQRRELIAGLISKGRNNPAQVRSRVFTNEQVTWWRPEPTGQCYRISAEGIELDNDPPGIFLAVPSDDGRHTSTDVDLAGERNDLIELLSIWSFSDTELAMIEGWLVCAMGSLSTPILFIKSAAGTGKTTLARWLAAIIEPFASEPPARIMRDERHFLRQVMAHPVVVIDNVSRVESAVEDTLSQLVTGAAFSIRPLYEDRLVELFLRRAVILTTTNYDIYKGDLASRTVVLEPARKTHGYFSDRELQKRVAHLFPKVRGYVMKLLATYFQKRGDYIEPNIPFRIGDLGMVFATLGYDTDALAQQESMARSAVVSINDPWLESIVELWKEEDSIYVFKTTREIHQWMLDYGCVDAPPEKSPRLPRWFAEKAPFFADYGFSVERWMQNPRGYKFRRIELARSTVG